MAQWPIDLKNHRQISDLADKLETWDNNMGRGAYVMGHDSTDRKAEDKLSKVDIARTS